MTLWVYASSSELISIGLKTEYLPQAFSHCYLLFSQRNRDVIFPNSYLGKLVGSPCFFLARLSSDTFFSDLASFSFDLDPDISAGFFW